MTWFGRTSEESHDRVRAASGPALGAGLSIIAAGTQIDGELHVDGMIRIDGKVAGDVRGKGQVLLGKDGVVEGDIHAHEAILDGRVVGSICAEERVEVLGSAEIQGDITTPQLALREGGRVTGRLNVGAKATASQSATTRGSAAVAGGAEAQRPAASWRSAVTKPSTSEPVAKTG